MHSCFFFLRSKFVPRLFAFLCISRREGRYVLKIFSSSVFRPKLFDCAVLFGCFFGVREGVLILVTKITVFRFVKKKKLDRKKRDSENPVGVVSRGQLAWLAVSGNILLGVRLWYACY